MGSREAGGFWISPQGEVHPVKGHAPFAYKVLSNELIGASETQRPTTTEDGELDFKGIGGAEAKDLAVKQLGNEPDSQVHNQSLRDHGWVQVSREGSSVTAIASSSDIIKSAWPYLYQLLDPAGYVDIVIIGPDGSTQARMTTQEVVDGAERGAAEVMRRLETTKRTSFMLGGLGMWIRRAIDGPKYFVE